MAATNILPVSQSSYTKETIMSHNRSSFICSTGALAVSLPHMESNVLALGYVRVKGQFQTLKFKTRIWLIAYFPCEVVKLQERRSTLCGSDLDSAHDQHEVTERFLDEVSPVCRSTAMLRLSDDVAV